MAKRNGSKIAKSRGGALKPVSAPELEAYTPVGLPASGLVLPAFDPRITTREVLNSYGGMFLLQGLNEAGLLKEHHFSHFRNPMDVVMNTFRSILPDTRVQGLSFSECLGFMDNPYEKRDPHGPFLPEHSERHVPDHYKNRRLSDFGALYLGCQRRSFYIIENKAPEFDKLLPGFIDAIYWQVVGALAYITVGWPGTHRETARSSYWGELGSFEKAVEDDWIEATHFYTNERDKIDFPERWCTPPKKPAFSFKAPKGLGQKRAFGHRLDTIYEMTLELSKIRPQAAWDDFNKLWILEEHYSDIGTPIQIRYNEKSAALDILDEAYNNAMQVGADTSVFYGTPFLKANAADCGKAISECVQLYRTTELGDEILNMIFELDDRK